ncbi:MAG: hypothetical protein CMN85_09210 [Spongiibacteraceae bacterium]|nr:hypothetical protein [Spongiibacteraceae bacterium]
MIEYASQMLEQFIAKERQALDGFEMLHMPTLGEAYEAIAGKGIDQQFVLPKSLGLKVVSGFVTVAGKQLPNQIDCMLVDGEGAEYGLTGKYIYPIEQVLCILEVKKTLNKADLLDAMYHLGAIKKAATERICVQLDNNEFDQDISAVRQHFAQISGYKAPESVAQLGQLPVEKNILFHSLLFDHFCPSAVILGFDGYKTEAGLRGAFLDILEGYVGQGAGFGMPSLPSLVLSNNFSLLKNNGLPFLCKWENNDWVAFSSTRENPARILLEVVWTKICHYCRVKMPWNDGLHMESLSPLLIAEAVVQDGLSGWKYNSHEFKEKALSSRPSLEWEPALLSAPASTLFGFMMTKGGWICSDDTGLCDYLKEKHGLSLKEISSELIGTGYFMYEGNGLRPVHDHTMQIDVDGGQGRIAHDRDKFDAWCEKYGHSPYYMSLLIIDEAD